MNFSQLLYDLYPKLKQLACKYQRYTVFADQDDLLNEMEIFLWKQWRTGLWENKTESYIVQACYFHLRNYLRTVQEKVRSRSLDETGVGPARDPADQEEGFPCGEMLIDGSPDIEAGLESNALYDTIMNNGFSPLEKEIIARLCEGYTVREIGKKLRISHTMVVKHKKNICNRVYKEYAELLV